jgi:hypothetical protein
MRILDYTTCYPIQGPLSTTSNMADRKRIWRVVVPMVLLVLLLGATLGTVWHHHADSAADTCSLCHLVIAPAVAGISACHLIPVGAGPVSHYLNFISQSVPPQIPARAPPA